MMSVFCVFFFFQAEDGIRDKLVTGVQTCALPISEAAAALGADRWTTLRRVTLPMLGPALGGAALLVFMTSMASFSAPYVFGGGFRVLTTQLYSSKLNGEDGLVAVEAVVLAAASLLFLFLLQRYESNREYTGAGKGLGAGRRESGG